MIARGLLEFTDKKTILARGVFLLTEEILKTDCTSLCKYIEQKNLNF